MKNMLMGSPYNNEQLNDENDSPEMSGDKTDKRKKSILGKSIGGAQSAFLGVSREKAANSIVKLIYILGCSSRIRDRKVRTTYYWWLYSQVQPEVRLCEQEVEARLQVWLRRERSALGEEAGKTMLQIIEATVC